MNLLLLSNSTMPGQPYLGWPRDIIHQFLGNIRSVVFVPYAAVNFGFDHYEKMVAEALSETGIQVHSIHGYSNQEEAILSAEAIMVGGGNSFHLLYHLYETGLLNAIRARVHQGIPYIGWSAGANVACPTIKTTNDMPIIQPRSFEALNFVPFQINPHYTEMTIPGHGGESRLQRLQEYSVINELPVICLPEGCGIKVHGRQMYLIASEGIKLLKQGGEVITLSPGAFHIE